MKKATTRKAASRANTVPLKKTLRTTTKSTRKRTTSKTEIDDTISDVTDDGGGGGGDSDDDVTDKTPKEKNENQIFKDLRFLLIPQAISNVQAGILRQKISERGGSVVDSFDKNVTHIITELTGSKLKKVLLKVKNAEELDDDDKLVVVKPRWISVCVSMALLVEVDTFRVSLKENQPQKNNADSSSQTKIPIDTPDRKRKHEENRDIDIDYDAIRKASKILKSSLIQEKGSTENDPLSEMITQTKQLIQEGLISGKSDDENPGDESESEEASEGFDSGSENNESTTSSVKSTGDEIFRLKTKGSLTSKNQKRHFQCMDSHVYGEADENPNKLIIDKLTLLFEHYLRTNDKWREFAYRKAISAIKKQWKPITSYEEAKAIPSVGERIAKKIAEILETGHLRKLDNLEDIDDVIKIFTQIYGVGARLARQFYAQGYRTLENLAKNANLSSAQIAGIECYDDLLERIPREEVTKISEFVTNIALSIDPKLQCITGGSYRRRQPNCGDVDILITRDDSDGCTHEGALTKLLQLLHEKNFITHDLTQHRKDGLSAKYRGICRFPGGKYRRLDLFTVPYCEYGAALIMYTGNDIFNRSMRFLARTKHMRLNEHGLYANVARGRGGVKQTEGTLIAQKTEKEIFDALGVPYREPHERVC